MGTEAVNDWNFWVYPAQVTIAEGKVYTTDTLDSKALEILQNGGTVPVSYTHLFPSSGSNCAQANSAQWVTTNYIPNYEEGHIGGSPALDFQSYTRYMVYGDKMCIRDSC